MWVTDGDGGGLGAAGSAVGCSACGRRHLPVGAAEATYESEGLKQV